MRLLGVDFGFRRIGLAVTDTELAYPRPKPPMTASGTLATDAKALWEVAKREGAEGLVLGFPLEPDGAEGRMARIVRQLAGNLSALGVEVHLVDERLSTVEAEKNLRREPLTASQRGHRRDAEAACLILERFLATTGGTMASAGTLELEEVPDREQKAS